MRVSNGTRAAWAGKEAFAAIDEVRGARYRREGFWIDRLLCDFVDEYARSAPDRTAFVDSRGAIRYADLQSASYRLADALLSEGMMPGDVVAVQLPNWIEFSVLHLALVRLGAVTCLVTPMSRERDVAVMLRISRARWIVTAARFRGFDHAAMFENLAASHGEGGLRIVVVEEGSSGTPRTGTSFGRLLASGRDDPGSRAAIDSLRPDPDSIAEIVFTSGTTADPKGVMHTHNTLLAPQLAMASRLRLQAGAVLHMASTVGHQTGFLNGIRLPMQIGGVGVLQDVWDPARFASLVEEHRIEVSSGSATFLLDVLRSPALDRHDLSSFRIFRCGGGPIPAALVREAEARLPGLTVVRGWGQTENGVVTMTHLDDPARLRTETDGTVQAGMQVRIVDASDACLPPGTEGRLQCRGASMCVAYANDPALLEACYHDGWFDTGDLAVGVEGEDGRPYIRVTGRAKDIIIRGGENVPVSYVENILYEDPRIDEVAIVGMADDRLGERACAFAILREGSTLRLEEMKSFLAAKGVAAPWWPERLEVVAAFPRAANGKVNKAALRAILCANPKPGEKAG